MVARAPARRRKKKPITERKFASMMEEVFVGAKERRKVSRASLREYEKVAKERVPTDWRKFLSEVITISTKPRKMRTMNEYVKTAMSVRTPKRVRKKEEKSVIIKRMVASRVPGMPKLKESAVAASLDLAGALEKRKINFKKWSKEVA